MLSRDTTAISPFSAQSHLQEEHRPPVSAESYLEWWVGFGIFLSQRLMGQLLMELEQRKAHGVSGVILSPPSVLLMEAGVSGGDKRCQSPGCRFESRILPGTLLRWLST